MTTIKDILLSALRDIGAMHTAYPTAPEAWIKERGR